MARTFRNLCYKSLRAVLIALSASFYTGTSCAMAQDVAVHTNLPYWATATPNLGLELSLHSHWTLAATVGYNAFNFPNHTNSEGFDANPKLHHWLAFGEGRYWQRHTFRGLYFGLHALGGQFNAGGVRFPFFLHNSRYEGWAIGTGLSVGYRLPLGRRWGIEASVGAGLWHLHYNKYECGSCGRRLYTRTRNTPGITKVAITVSYLFPTEKARPSIPTPETIITKSITPEDTVVQTATPVLAEAPLAPVNGETTTNNIAAAADTTLFIIHFPVDRADYLPDFADNRAEMERVHACLRSIADTGGSITLISVTGYASPEYEPEYNKKLSEARARAAVGAVVAEGMPVGAPFTVTGRGADWDGWASVKAYPPLRRAEIRIIHIR